MGYEPSKHGCCLICLSFLEECTPTTATPGGIGFYKNANVRKGKVTACFEKELLADHLRVMFLLKNLLEIPNETLENYLENWGSPAEWIRLCGSCHNMVQEAWENYQRILGVMRKFVVTRNKIVEDVRTAKVYKDGSFRSNKPMAIGLITGEVRGFVKAKVYPDVTITYQLRSGNVENLEEGLLLITPKNEVTSDHDVFEDIPPEESLVVFDDNNDVNWPLFDDDDIEQKCNETQEECDDDADDGVSDGDYLFETAKRVLTNHAVECKLCGKEYPNQHGLSVHLGRSHGDVTRSDKYVCKVKGCGKEFKWRQSFSDHMARHRNEKRFKCDICGREFFKNDHFKRHTESHRKNKIPTTFSGGKRGPGRKPDVKKLHSTAEKSGRDSNKRIVLDRPNKVVDQRRTTTKEYIDKKEKSGKQESHALTKKRKDQRKIVCTVEGCGKEFSWVQTHKTHMASIHRQETRFECETCGKRFYKASSLRLHSKSHERKTIPATLDDTPEVRKIVNVLEEELIPRPKKVSEDKEWKCTECGNVYDSQQALNIHVGVKHKELKKTAKLLCSVEGCGKVYQVHQRQHYRLHMAKHRKETRFRCSLCGKEFYVKASFLHHKQAHQRNTILIPAKMKSESTVFTEKNAESDEDCPKPYICELCGLSFATEQTLKRHMLQAKVHLPSTDQLVEYICKHCGRDFKTKSTLTYHELTHDEQNENLTSFKCEHCGKGFRNKGYLTLHMKSHFGPPPKRDLEGLKKYICDLCGSKFRRKEYLKSHKRFVHEKKWVLYCELCGKGMRGKQDLRLHMRRTHKLLEEGMKAFKCTVVGCKQRFFDEQRFKDHMQKYHPSGGEGDPHPFTCHQCGRGFWIVARLNAHLLRHERAKEKSRRMPQENIETL